MQALRSRLHAAPPPPSRPRHDDPADRTDGRDRRAARWVLVYVALKGLNALSWEFLTDTPPGNPSDAGGGFANGIIGSLIIVGLATVLAVPMGIACAIYLNQYAPAASPRSCDS